MREEERKSVAEEIRCIKFNYMPLEEIKKYLDEDDQARFLSMAERKAAEKRYAELTRQ